MKKSFLVRPIILAASLLLQLGTFCFHSHGEAGDVDLSFDPGSAINGPVRAVALQPDGKMIIGGEFTMVKGLARLDVARLNADGSGDSSFVLMGGYYGVSAVALQPDGKVLVGHNHGIARHNSDGSLDNSFFASFDSLYDETFNAAIVESVAVQADGKLVIGGYFYVFNGANVNYGIARLNTNGGLDDSFSAPLLNNYSYPWIRSVALQTDGRVLLSGQFGNGTNNNITRLNSNGSLDDSFNAGTGVNSDVHSVVVQADGKVLIGGGFSTVNGTNRNGIARLNANGSLDGTFNPGTGISASYYARVHSVTVQSDGKPVIGGSFTNFNGTSRNGIARLNPDGSLDSSFDPGTGVVPYYYDGVYSVLVQSDGKVVIAGAFTTVNGTNRNRVARLGADGSVDASFYPGGGGLEYPVYTLALQSDGKVRVNGWIQLNADGSRDDSYTYVPNTNFNPTIDVPGTDYSVAQSFAVQPDGKMLFGGYTVTTIYIDEFGNPYYSFGYFVVRFNADGSRDTNFNLAVGGYDAAWYRREPWSHTVRALAVQPDGRILVGGSFGQFGGTNRNGIARLNANGSLDGSFVPGFGGNVYSMLLQPDGRVLVGSTSGLAWLNTDGSRDPCFNPGINFSSYYNTIVVVLQPDGRVLVGGSFSTVNGVSRNGIARLNDNGSLDTSFDPGTGANGAVRAIALQPDGNILIGGDFLSVNGFARPYVARLFGGLSGPRLRLFPINNAVVVAWPSPSAGFTLQQNTNLAAPNWVNVVTAPTTVGLENQVTIATPTGQRFFRLFSISTNTPPPPAPPGPAPSLTAVGGDGSVSLSWTTLAGATGHHVQRATNYNGPFTTIASPATASYTDTAVVNGTDYYYRVSVTYPCGESANSVYKGAIPYFTPTVHVQSITMSFVPQGARYRTRAVVRVVDNSGSPFSGATVTGNFTGAINDTGRTGVTSGNGEATITSSSTIKNGTVTFTVTGVAAGTVNYNPAANVVTSATISR